MPDFVVLTTTTGDHAVANRIATELVDRRLVACAQISGPVRSVYRWQGRVESTEEIVVTFKTIASNIEAVQETIARLHPYDVPELIVTPIIGGSKSYLDWMDEQTRPSRNV